ncbi:MAG TPA: hypothetical protein VFZ24_10370 [Longimicrobiales bacterium]
MTVQLRRLAARVRSLPLRVAGPIAVTAALAVSTAACTDVLGGGDQLEIIWPSRDAVLYDEEVLRARVRNRRLEDYEIYWYVDNSSEQRMWDEWDDGTPHKVYVVDTWFWDWRGSGPYTVGFIAEDYRGREIARRTVRVYVE